MILKDLQEYSWRSSHLIIYLIPTHHTESRYSLSAWRSQKLAHLAAGLKKYRWQKTEPVICQR